MIVENNAQYSAKVSADSVSEDLELPATPLARNHMAQKHSYPLNEYGRNNIGIESFDEIHIDRQLASLAVEAAIAIVINGIHYAVLMASPSQLDYLAVGFLFSEGLIEHSHELLDWEVTQLTDSASLKSLLKIQSIKLMPQWHLSSY